MAVASDVLAAAGPAHAGGDGRTTVALPELLALRARVGSLRLPQRQSRAARAGQQSSRLYGRGMDYAESRAYQGGDDVRRLDWRLTARSGKLHTKLFQEEREGRLLILLDTHASMHFGTRTRFKSVQAARAAALAGWLAIRAGERVGALAFGGLRQSIRPHGGLHGALALCAELTRWSNEAASDGSDEPLSDALARADRLTHGASRVLLISDGQSCDAAARQRLLGLARHADVGVLIVADALELAPPPPGRYPFEQAGEYRVVDLHAARPREDFQRALGAGQARLRALAQALGLPWRSIDTSSDPLDAVSSLLGARGWR